MAKEIQPKPAPPEERTTGEAASSEELDLWELLQTYGRALWIAVLVAALIVTGVGLYKRHQRQAVEAASRMLVSGRIEQLEAILKQYRRTPPAPIAHLAMARVAFHNGQFEDAERRYAEFLQVWPRHPLASVAEVNRATTLEARGRLNDALKLYEAFLARDKTSVVASIAMLGRARTLDQMGKYEEARQAYEACLAANPEGPMRGPAEAGLKLLEQKRRAARRAVEATLSATANPTSATPAETASGPTPNAPTEPRPVLPASPSPPPASSPGPSAYPTNAPPR